MSPLNAAICTTISYTLWVEWYYLNFFYLTLRSKVKVPRRSLRYMTHRLMVHHALFLNDILQNLTKKERQNVTIFFSICFFTACTNVVDSPFMYIIDVILGLYLNPNWSENLICIQVHWGHPIFCIVSLFDV
jgi:hypothetical protein